MASAVITAGVPAVAQLPSGVWSINAAANTATINDSRITAASCVAICPTAFANAADRTHVYTASVAAGVLTIRCLDAVVPAVPAAAALALVNATGIVSGTYVVLSQ
jgi:hypothetical protein